MFRPHLFISAAAIAFLPLGAYAQPPAPTAPPPITSTAAAASLTFDVASIRPSPPLDPQKIMADMQAGKMPKFGPHIEGPRAEFNYMSLKDLIAYAWKVKAYQVTGPDWLPSQHFDIVAKMPDGATKDDAPAMLQALLKDRFKLMAHRDTQEHPVLALVVGKGGSKLKASPSAPTPIDPDSPLKPGEMKVDTQDGQMRVMRNSDGSTTVNMGAKGTMVQRMDMEAKSLHIESSTVTMEGFADMLTNVMQMGGTSGRQVIDKTGLTGNYQIAVDLSLADLMASARAQGMNVPSGGGPGAAGGSSAPEASDPTGGSNVYASVQALGLKLEPRKAPVEQLMIDHIEKTPTDN